MILYYAVGGGLGHLTRARAVIHTLALGSDVPILTASDHASDSRVVGDLPVIEVPQKLRHDLAGYRRWLTEQIHSLQPSEIFVDSFPAGLFGELCERRLFDGIRMHYVCRALRWERYRARVRCIPHYEESLILEPLEEAHSKSIEDFSETTRALRLTDPPHEVERDVIGDEPVWLIVHTGPESEVETLVSYAAEARAIEGEDAPLLIVSQGDAALDASHRRANVYPALPLFERASRVFTGCGFNVMRQMEPWRDKHVFIPFERPLDDQFARAARTRAER